MRALRLILIAALLLGARAALAADTSVTLRKTGFSPSTVRISVGDTVTWTNNDSRDHAVSVAGGSSGNLKPGDSWSKRFNKAGEYTVRCSLHPRESMLIVVE